VHTPAIPALTLLALLTLGYLIRRLTRPFKTCRRCHGMGRIPRRIGRPKPCRHCDGHGIRPRLTHKAARTTRRTYHDAR
jgi:DnaJ-class molecular chaperone